MMPNFVGVGPGRSGTTWLYEVFLEHPEIGMAKVKETQFFHKNYSRGSDWYESLFVDVADKKAIGEISNEYIFDPVVPGRLKESR